MLTDYIVDRIRRAGSDNVEVFGGDFEGGYHIQQQPEELARLVSLLASLGPFRSSLDIGVAAGGTTRFIRELVGIASTAVIDDGRHPKFPHWRDARGHCGTLHEFIGDSHSPAAADFLRSLSRPFDLVAIDGDHSLEGVTADWHLVQPFLAPRALVWFHDTRCCPGVAALWSALRAEHDVLLETHGLGIGVLRVLSHPQSEQVQH